MKRIGMMSCLVAVPLLAAETFVSSQKIELPNNPEMGEYISPLHFDWDGDGVSDLIVGDLCREGGNDKGRILFFRNSGSNQVPQFEPFELLADDQGNSITSSSS